jgi:4'-phosphopantetheinyl transferase
MPSHRDLVPDAAAWSAPAADLCLSRGEAHVWRVDTAVDPAAVARCWAVLSGDERARAEALVRPEDRRRRTVAWAAVREILSRYLARLPQNVHFMYGPRGKPAVAGAASRVTFNLSHSGDMALVAVARGKPIGVDVERIRPVEGLADVARKWFARWEFAALERMPEGARVGAFFRYWTRREAILKAEGVGLGGAGGESVADLARWTVHDLDAGDGCAAAVAVAEGTWRVRTWQWHEAAARSARPWCA